MNTSFDLNITTKDLIESYTCFISKQTQIKSYRVEIMQFRAQIVEWIIFLCKNLSFKPETLFRAISIFDAYISKSQKKTINTINELKLNAIACLSIATKIEEINCNFINFLTNNVLNSGADICYTVKDLASKEIQVLQTLRFNTNQSTAFQFLTVFQHSCSMIYGNSQALKWIISCSEATLTQIISSDNAINMLDSEIAFYAINQALSQWNFNLNTINYSVNNVWNLIQNVISCSTNPRISLLNNNLINPIELNTYI